MNYIRDRKTELTCYQEGGPLTEYINIGQDVVCVYGIDDNMPERVRKYRENGYRVHLMTGIAWGNYAEFLSGAYDGEEHWDIQQRSRDGSLTGGSIHSLGYYVPTIPYVDFLIQKMKRAVDAGVEAIHVEEPEFLEAGGYSEAFRREYLMYYHEPWVAPHTSPDAHYRAAKLKVWLYRRTIERASQSLKDYALSKYGRYLRFYVPTHSLLNYSQWKVMSPEGTLTDVPTLDGYKAQIWMGTSREANVYKGVYKERTFETAFLEYGVMQELVRSTGRDMWFDNDPIEDRPDYTWESYRENYIKTLAGSLLQPKINRFQICPWPSRIFSPDRRYPSGSPDAMPIPEDYRTLLMNVFQMQGTFGTEDYEYADDMPEAGVFLSDTALFQRCFSDDVLEKRSSFAPVGKIDVRCHANYEIGLEEKLTNGDRLNFYESFAFPLFYGLALPLLKGGLPIRPVQLENIVRYPEYLSGYKLLVLSYEFQKPQGADINIALASYVRDGGILVYVGDGADPFHKIRSWWNSGGKTYNDPAEHLFGLFGLPADAPGGEYPFGKGRFVLMRRDPADLCVEEALCAEYRGTVEKLLGVRLDKNYIQLRRGEYLITAVMDEGEKTDGSVGIDGLFCDMLSPGLPVITHKTVEPDNFSVLLDLTRFVDPAPAVVGTSVRVESLTERDGKVTLTGVGAECEAVIRLRLNRKPVSVEAGIRLFDSDETVVPDVATEWDERSSTALLKFRNRSGKLTINLFAG